jgi:DNA polymerase-3 subunit delta'
MICQGTKSPGCTCFNCLQVSQKSHPDITIVGSVDGKDIGIDVSRSIIELSGSFPMQAPVRFFIIDGVDRLTMPAANALLKLLEEPPATSRYVLIAEIAEKVIPTIRSRCGLVTFRPLPDAMVLSTLQRFEKDDAKALVYSRLSEGSVGRAIQFWGAGRLTLRDKVLTLLASSRKRDVAAFFSLIDQLDKDLPLALHFLTLILHDLIMLNIGAQKVINVDKVEELRALGRGVDVEVWQTLRKELTAVLRLYRGTRIQLGFHVKSLLAECFAGV